MERAALSSRDGSDKHRLDALLRPSTIALVGASARVNSNGLALAQMARLDGYAGHVLPVNPRYSAIEGLACYRSLDALPTRAEHVVLSLPADQLESGLVAAIAHGAKAATIFGNAHLDDEAPPLLIDRIAAMAREADIALCGPNSMGFYNRTIGLRVASFPSPPGLRAGGIVFIAQSGSAFSALAHNDRRLGFSLCVSSGMELTTTAADYADWALSRPETRVIAMFLEEVRQPERFMATLARASERDVPVVILKVGRTARSAAMALTHTGALAGSDAAFAAMCRSHDVVLVDDLDELATMLQFFDQPCRLGPGWLASMHDSGGERELVVDIAERTGVQFAAIAPATRAAIQPHLDAGLVADNPLDAWGTARNYVDRYAVAFQALVADPAVAAGVFYTDVREGYWYSAGLVEATRRVAATAGKPVMIATNYSKTFNHNLAASLAAEGIPILEGTRESLLAINRGFAWRDRRRTRRQTPEGPTRDVVHRWTRRLAEASPLDEFEALALLHDFNLPTGRTGIATSADEANRLAASFGRPVALKTAMPGIAHKSDVGGVHLKLATPAAVEHAYRDLERRLGSRVLVSEMAPPGIEIAVGAVVDPAFGPLVIVSAGGTLIEMLEDKVANLAPFDEEDARAMLADLRIMRLLRGVRGAPPCNLEALARAIAAFSVLAATLANSIAEMDVNPIIASADGAIAVDALVVSRQGAT